MLRHPHKEGFLAAAQKEYTEVDERHTWKAVPRPQKTQVNPLMWVFTYKFDTNGQVQSKNLCARRLAEVWPTGHMELRTKLKHVDIHHHWLRQEVQAKRLLIE
jgi:hypothetical protein